MRSWLLVLTGLLLTMVAALSVFVVPLLPRQMSWRFVESVGGIAVRPPQRIGQVWVLPVEADVSGLRNITTKSTTVNSGIVCKEVRSRVENRAIYLTVVTQPAGLGQGGAGECPPTTRLGRIAAGKYMLLYAGPFEAPHPLSPISIVLPSSLTAAPWPAWLAKLVAAQPPQSSTVIEEATYDGRRVFHILPGDRGPDTGNEHVLRSEDGKVMCEFGGVAGHVTRGSCDIDKIVYLRTIYPPKRPTEP